MLILGLTSGIGGGKSVVAEMFRRQGAAVVSADTLAREVVRPGAPTLKRIVEHFGAGVLQEDGTLDRARLAEKIFADPEARRALDRMTHPAIAERARCRFAALAQAGAGLVVYDAPLLYEAGADAQVDAVAVVAVEEPVQLQRLMARDGLDLPAAKARVAAQMPLEEKVARADYVIDNNGSLENTRRQVSALMAALLRQAGGPYPGSAE